MTGSALVAAERAGPQAGLPPAVRETLQIFWESPFPALVQDAAFRIVDVNDAFSEFSGYSRAALVGRDANDLLPEEDRASNRENRKSLHAPQGRLEAPYLSEGRLIDAGGFVRWYRVSRRVLADERGAPLYFAALQDTTLEHAARAEEPGGCACDQGAGGAWGWALGLSLFVLRRRRAVSCLDSHT